MRTAQILVKRQSHFLNPEKSKPSQRMGRKATGLRSEPSEYGRRAARRNTVPPLACVSQMATRRYLNVFCTRPLFTDLVHPFLSCNNCVGGESDRHTDSCEM